MDEDNISSETDTDEEMDCTLFDEYTHNPIFSLFEENEEEDDPLDSSCTHSLEETVENQSALNLPSSEDVQRGLKLLSSIRRTMNRSTFLGVISIYGKARFTFDSYDHLVAMMMDADNGTVMPSSSTMRKFVFPRLLNTNFVESAIKTLPFKRNYNKYARKSKFSRKQAEAVVVLPTSWAKMDIASLHILREITCVTQCRCAREFGSTDIRVNSSNHVVKRGELSEHSSTLWVNKNGVPTPSYPGMQIRIHSSNAELISSLRREVRGFTFEQVEYRGEVCTALDVEIISTLHIKYSVDKGVYISDGLSPILDNSSLKNKYEKCLQYLKTLCRDSHKSTSDLPQDPIHQLEDAPRTRRQRQKQHSATDSRVDCSTPFLIPSDHVTIVRFGNGGPIGALVSRFWVDRIDDERNFFLCIHGDNEVQCTSLPTFGAPTFVSEGTHRDTEPTYEPECRTTGFLSSGMRYYIYRIILYADDFNPRSTLFPKGSVGGVYMSPTGLHVRSRRSQYSIRTISLTPAGVSTNAIIDLLIDDLVSGSVDGFECVDAFGERVKVFLDVMGFTGDYPAASAVVDHSGHNSTAPCTHCGFNFNKSAGMTVYAYTTSVTSRHTSYRRTQERTESLRALRISSRSLKILGMKSLASDELLESNACPLFKLASRYNLALESHSDIPPFSATKRDGYMMNLIAPDHLITGLFKGLLTITFIQLDNDDAREKLDVYLKVLLSEFGFQSQSTIFKRKKKKLVPGLSMSILYCLLTVLPSTLKALGLFDRHPAKGMITNLHRLFALAFWWPTVSHDGQTAWRLVHGSHMNMYHRTLQVLAANFVKSVSKYSRSHPNLAVHVDKPNTHRLLELVQHTIPLFNHVAFICELVFESAHQPLKYFLSRNHTLGSHIYAIQLVLAKDWLVRIRCLWCIYKDTNESSNHRHYALMGLLRLFVGSDLDSVNWKALASSTIFNDLREHIEHLMTGTVERRFMAFYQDSQMSFSSEASWKLQPRPRGHIIPSRQKRFLDISLEKLARLCLQDRDELTLYHTSVLERGYGSNSVSSHERLNVGDIVQVLLGNGFENKQILSSMVCSNGTPNFFVVGGILGSRCSKNWIVTKHCTLISPSTIGQLPDHNKDPFVEVYTPDFYKPNTNELVYFLPLLGTIRKVGVIHNCARKKSVSSQREQVWLNIQLRRWLVVTFLF